MVTEVERIASTQHFHVILVDSNDDAREEQAHLQMLAAERVDGVIMAPCGETNRTQILDLAREIPVVLFDRRLVGATIDMIAGDNELGGYLASQPFDRSGALRSYRLSDPAS